MSWPSSGSIPAEVTAMRDMLANSASWVAAGGAEAKVDYPDATLGAAQSFPRMLIVREVHNRKTYSAGSAAMASGMLRLELYAALSISAIEALAQAIAAELCAQTTGLNIQSASTDLAGDIPGSRQAAIDDSTSPTFRIAVISVVHGLNV